MLDEMRDLLEGERQKNQDLEDQIKLYSEEAEDLRQNVVQEA